MRHYTIVGNWKMHQTPDQAGRLAERLQKQVKPHTHVTTVICPPFISLPVVNKKVERDTMLVGAQNLHELDEGAFTGEVSGPMLKGLADYVIIGHSERRKFEKDNDKRIAKKMGAAIRNGLRPILCVGEKLTERHSGHAARVVVAQLHACLAELTADDMPQVLIAYEPIWAIGTGEFATPDVVEPVVGTIRETVEELYGEAASADVEVLYGGSVNDDNAKSYLSLDNVGGLLIGGASLNYEQFAGIVSTAAELSDGR